MGSLSCDMSVENSSSCLAQDVRVVVGPWSTDSGRKWAFFGALPVLPSRTVMNLSNSVEVHPLRAEAVFELWVSIRYRNLEGGKFQLLQKSHSMRKGTRMAFSTGG